MLVLLAISAVMTISALALCLTSDCTATQQELNEVSRPIEVVQSSLVDNPVENVDEPASEDPEIVEPSSVEEPPYSEYEHEILSIIIYQEAGSDKCSDDTRRKVGSVFLNRVASPIFPDTFEGVATARAQYGTLYWTGIEWPSRASSPHEAHAVQRAREIAEELLCGGSILPANVIWQAEFAQGDGVYCYQDNIYFCYSEVR